jgi:DNA-binding PadR family transcriptional regulator
METQMMFGRNSEFNQGKWAARHGWRGQFGRGFGGGRHGMGGEDFMGARRMLAQGDLRLIALALIAEQPRHGYEIIKVLEDKTSGWYSPSPGIVYPTLTYLEEAGYVVGQAEGAKKLYSITAEGRVYLEENSDFVRAVLDRLAAIGERFAHMRRRDQREEERAQAGSPLLRAAIENLKDVALARLAQDPEGEPKVIELLARAAGELKRL